MNLLNKFFLKDKNILILISINAIIIFLQGFPLEIINASYHHAFTIIDDIISILFVMELIVKSKHYGLKKYLESGWNKFDVFLILLSLPPLILRLLPLHFTTNIGFVLIFRVFRVFKFFRFIHFFPEVEQIFRSIKEALHASFMVFVGFFVFIFIMSVLSCYFYQEVSPEYFGDPITAYYSMFKVFTIEGWNAIPDDMVNSGKLSVAGAFFTKLYFTLILIFGGIIGLSIVNSIFVDAMVSDNNDKLEDQVQELKEDLKKKDAQLQHIVTLLERKKDDKEINNLI